MHCFLKMHDKNQDTKLLFLSRWWRHFGRTSQLQGSIIIAQPTFPYVALMQNIIITLSLLSPKTQNKRKSENT
jgi:hypothetical protein